MKHVFKNSILNDRTYLRILTAVAMTCFCFLIIRLSLGFSNPAFNFDGRYFMSAADCIRHGLSPYDVNSFFGCWETRTGTPQRSSYVFPPHTLVLAAPMSLLDRPLADLFLLTCQCLAFVFLSWLSVVFLKYSVLDSNKRWLSILWLFLCLTNTGIVGAVYLGQLSFFVGVGLVALALAVQFNKAKLWLPGLLLSLMKPHLTALAVFSSFVMDGRRNYVYKIIAVIVLAAANLWIFVIDIDFLSNLASSLAYHAESRYSDVSRPEELFGIPGLLVSATPAFMMLSAAIIFTTAAISWRLSNDCTMQIARIAAFASLVILGVMMVPHKQYDFSVYSIVFLAAAVLPPRVQTMIAIPLLIVWRPSFLYLVGADERLYVNVCLLVAFAILLAYAGRRLMLHSVP